MEYKPRRFKVLICMNEHMELYWAQLSEHLLITAYYHSDGDSLATFEAIIFAYHSDIYR